MSCKTRFINRSSDTGVVVAMSVMKNSPGKLFVALGGGSDFFMDSSK